MPKGGSKRRGTSASAKLVATVVPPSTESCEESSRPQAAEDFEGYVFRWAQHAKYLDEKDALIATQAKEIRRLTKQLEAIRERCK